jgi:exosortase/archaeosortase family protein
MRVRDFAAIGVLALLAGFIWMRDLRWLDSAGDTLPMLAGLPLFFWLGQPWRLNASPSPLAPGVLLGAAALFALGVAIGFTLPLAAGWTLLLWAWLASRFKGVRQGTTRKLLVLAFVSFPWVATDFERVGWWFRLSGAGAAEGVLSWCNYEVVRNGTFLLIDGFAASIEPACSGMNGLQSMLLAGTVLAYLKLKDTPAFWWNLPLLVVAAWTANLIRIVTASAFGASLTPEQAERWVGPMHLYGGWVALCAMFAVCWVAFTAQEKWAHLPAGSHRRSLARGPWLELAVLGYCAWRSAELFSTWFTNPYDRLGWLAFSVWTLPLLLRRRNEGVSTSWIQSPAFVAAGVALVLLGDIGQLNVSKHAGLALVLAGFAPARGRLLWAAGAVAWVPALGWFASRFGVSPAYLAAVRVTIAVLAAGGFVYARRNETKSGAIKYAAAAQPGQ